MLRKKNDGGALSALTTFPAVLLLLAVLVHGTGEALHSQLLKLGESTWPGYAALRVEPVAPDCDPSGAAKEPDRPAAGDDFLDDLFGDEPSASADAAAQATAAAAAACKSRIQQFEALQAQRTPGLVAFVALESAVATLVQTGIESLRPILVLLLLISAIAATHKRAHIALRPARSRLEHLLSEGGQLLGNAVLLATSFFKWQVDAQSGIDVHHAYLPLLWMAGFTLLIALNILNLLRLPPPSPPTEGSSLGKALLTVPLYTNMALISGVYFFVVEQHPAGLGIYLQKISEHSLLYIHVGLYVWAGMLLKQTRLSHLSFDLVRPFALPPELLAFVVVVVSAIPTAYSGASGIFVIAAGAAIFSELQRAGARSSLALAATAMSGSLGVVLSPCLLVVIVAALNKQVTTDQLYRWGFGVYALTCALFFVTIWLSKQGPWRIAPWSTAKEGTLAAARAILPYGVILAGTLLAYWIFLDTSLDEHSAPVMLPALLLVLLVYDRRRKPEAPTHEAVVHATSETTEHIGALLMLMTLSVCLGGVIERGELMALVPESLGSPLVTMAVLVVFLVVIGMIMDPYGAVILVSAAVADIAYRNGIDPVHFWMVVLVAFELGYLSPPVALNHLLTRQVVGDIEEVHAPGESFWRRHERVAMPLVVMTAALLLVAFVPLLF